MRTLLLAACMAIFVMPSIAEDAGNGPKDAPEVPEARVFTSDHSLRLGSKTVKYETVYLKAYTDGRAGQAKADLAAYSSTTPNGHIRPLATEHRSRCSTETWYNHPNTPQKGEIQRY